MADTKYKLLGRVVMEHDPEFEDCTTSQKDLAIKYRKNRELLNEYLEKGMNATPVYKREDCIEFIIVSY